MAREYSHEELVELAYGKEPEANAVFYEKARLLVEQSKLAGRRIYEPRTYIRLSSPGVTDVISYQATPADIAKYPEEYEHYMQNRQGVRETVPVSIIPNVSLSHMQELIDLGLSDVKLLAESESVPPHLEYARQSAITLNRVLQEQKHASIQEEDKPEEEIHPALSDPEDRAEDRDGRGTVRPAHRPEHDSVVGQPQIQEVEPRSSREPAERNKAGGREHHRDGVNPDIMSNNWKVNMVWRQ